MLKMKRRPRPRTKHFEPSGLLEAWRPYLEKRDPGYQWDGSTMCDTQYSQPISKCMVYHEPLSELVKLAPTGFPSHGCLETTFGQIKDKYPMLFDDTGNCKKMLSDAVVSWRTMCKSLYDMKKNADVVPDILKPMVDAIELPCMENAIESSGASSKGAENTGGDEPMSLEQLKEMFSNDDEDETTSSDDDVEIINVQCQCPECQPRIPIPNPSRGGQRQETEVVSKKVKRIFGKQADPNWKPKKTTKKPANKMTKVTSNKLKGPCRIVLRHKDNAAYILDNNKTYVCKTSEKIHGEKYLDALNMLKIQIGTGAIKTKDAARDWLRRHFR